MIDLYFATSPNVYKIAVALEELELDYRLIPVDLSLGEHLDPQNIGGGPTAKLPVIVDHTPSDNGPPVTVFESGAILLHLTSKSPGLMPAEERARMEAVQWLFWQIGGLGPFSGQCFHFRAVAKHMAPDKDHEYSLRRYSKIMAAHWAVLERQLAGRDFLAGTYSIADIACYPWVDYLNPDEGRAVFPNVAKWHSIISERPAVRRAYAKCRTLDIGYPRNEIGTVIYPADRMKHLITH